MRTYTTSIRLPEDIEPPPQPFIEQPATSQYTYSRHNLFCLILLSLTVNHAVRPAFSRLFWTTRGKMSTGASSSTRPSKRSMPINDSNNDAFEMRKGKPKLQDYNATILSTRGYDDGESTDRIFNNGIMVNRDVDIHFESGAHDLTPVSREGVK